MFHPTNGSSTERATALARVLRAGTRPGATDIVLISSYEVDSTLLKQRLSADNWNIAHVRTCEEALAVMASILVPVVICDQGIAGGHWKQTIKAIFTSPHPAPVLLAADQYDWRLWIDTIDHGAFELVIRPFDGIEHKLKAAARHWQQGKVRRTWEQGFLK